MGTHDQRWHTQRSRELELVARTSRQLILGNPADPKLLEAVFAEIAGHLDMEVFFHDSPTWHPRWLQLTTLGSISEDERRHYSTAPVGEFLQGRVAERRAPHVVEDLPSRAQPGYEVLVASGPKSYVGVPLLAGETRLGTLAFISRRRSRFREGEVLLIQTLCDQITATLERARLLSGLQASSARQTFLLALSDRLRPLTDHAAIQHVAAEVLGRHLRAQRLGFAEDQGDGETVVVTRHYIDGVTSLEGRFKYDDCGPALLQTLQVGRAVVRSHIAHDDSLTDDEKAAHAALQIGAALNVPLLKHGKLVGVLFVHHRDPHAWIDEEVLLVTAVAERIWEAVQRGRTELALQASDERLRLAIDAAHVAVHDYDVLADRSVWSPALYELTGIPVGTPVTLAQIEVTIHPDDRSRISTAMSAAMDPCSSGSFVQEFRICRADSGAIRWVNNHSQTFFEGEGQARRPARSVGVLVDVTHRKTREEQHGKRTNSWPCWPMSSGIHSHPCVPRSGFSRHSNAVSVRVRDTGIGIEESMRGRVFDLFAQVAEARDRASGGLGIGLALTKRLVEMHGRTIEVSSEGRECGASFTVTLPIDQAATVSETSADRRDTETSEPQRTQRRRVLIADDNVDAADTLAMLLETMGCEVRTVYDGNAALREAKEFRPALVLLDLGMPGLDGPAVCTRLRQEPWGAEVVIAAVTGWGQDEDRRRTRAAGFDHHLVKPVESDALLELVRNLRNST